MKLVFFDEAKVESDHPHYHIGATCIDESDLKAVEKRIADLSEEILSWFNVKRNFRFVALAGKKGLLLV